MISKKM